MKGTGQTPSGLGCGFGALGICCQQCSLGPCRLNPFSQEPQSSRCGLSADALVLRNYLMRLTLGASSFACYGEKLVSKALNHQEKNVVRVARRALKDFSGCSREICHFLKSCLSSKQLTVLLKHKIAPRGIRESILEVLYELSSIRAEDDGLEKSLMKGFTACLAGLAGINVIRILESLLSDSVALSQTSFCRDRKAGKRDTLLVQEIVDKVTVLIAEGNGKGLCFVLRCDPLASLGQLEEKLTEDGHLTVVLGYNGGNLPQVHYLGDCIQSPQIIDVLSSLSSEIDRGVDTLPVAVIIPAKVNQETEMIATAMAVLGLPVYVAQPLPITGSQRISEFLTEGMKRFLGGHFVFGNGEDVVGTMNKLFVKRAELA